jgi:hypothetical protein
VGLDATVAAAQWASALEWATAAAVGSEAALAHAPGLPTPALAWLRVARLALAVADAGRAGAEGTVALRAMARWAAARAVEGAAAPVPPAALAAGLGATVSVEWAAGTARRTAGCASLAAALGPTAPVVADARETLAFAC